MDERKKTQADLAEAIGRNKTRANRIYNGAIPNEQEMPMIEAWTQGLVQPNDFFARVVPESAVGGVGHCNA
jgi:hypothetical protein